MMINKNMQEEKKISENKVDKKTESAKKPNEKAGLYFSSSIKITDTESGKVLLHIRGD